MMKYVFYIIYLAGLCAADCTPQAAGTCSFYLGEEESTLDQVSYQCGIYDHSCNGISAFVDCDPGLSITSQLPYTVDVTARGSSGNDIYANFNYGAGSYSKDNSGHQIEDCSSGLASCTNLYIQFPCDGF